MRNVIVLLATALAGVSACSKDEDALVFVRENDALVAEIRKSPDLGAARRVFDLKRGGLQSRLSELKTAHGFQLKQESTKAVEKSLLDGVSTICGLPSTGAADDDARHKALCDDYAALIDE